MDEIYEVLKNVEIKEDNMQKSQKGVFFGDLTEEILEPVLRFILLLEKPKEKPGHPGFFPATKAAKKSDIKT